MNWQVLKQRFTQFGDNKNYLGTPRFWWKSEVDKHGVTRTEDKDESTSAP